MFTWSRTGDKNNEIAGYAGVNHAISKIHKINVKQNWRLK
jgi:hypothetical protein